MKNLRQNLDDSLRPEYKRSDFGEMAQGKFANTQLEFAELVSLLIACIGEDQGLKFIHHSPADCSVGHKSGDWSYELDNTNQITLRFGLMRSETLRSEYRIYQVSPLHSSDQISTLLS